MVGKRDSEISNQISQKEKGDILDGAYVFKLVDTHGLPLDVIVLELRESGRGFNVATFIQAAYKAGWRRKRIEWMLRINLNDPKGLELLEFTIDYYEDKTN